MQIIDLLRNYRANKTRLAFLNEQAIEAQQEISHMKENILEDNQLITAHLDGLPSRSGVTNPTQSLALMMIDETSPAIQAKMKSLQQITAEIDSLSRLVRYAEILLEGLSEKERYVVQRHMIEGYSWNEIEEAGKYHLSIEGLKKIQKRAVQRMEAVYHG